MEKCALCGANTIHEIRDRKIKYIEHTITIRQLASYCDECGEAFLSPEDSKTTEKEISDFKRWVDNGQ